MYNNAHRIAQGAKLEPSVAVQMYKVYNDHVKTLIELTNLCSFFAPEKISLITENGLLSFRLWLIMVL